MSEIPASIYVHIPWCVRKCPYCDFNSHEFGAELQEGDYLLALQHDISAEADRFKGREISSVFFGGGTPSLFSAAGISRIIDLVAANFRIAPNVEITLEANPGTVEQGKFAAFRTAGVNRISLGVQSFDENHLRGLGRIHTASEAQRAIGSIIDAGFERWNIDLMHGLPEQTKKEAIHDLEMALSFQPSHVSWYQLTIEPNTVFYNTKPSLPNDDILADIQDTGHALLASSCLAQYEVSAYATPEQRCQHNLNYWNFGDYAALGAGAHGKHSSADANRLTVDRYWKQRQPNTYITDVNKQAGNRMLTEQDLIFEFMLNALRLLEGFDVQVFEARTGLPYSRIAKDIDQLVAEDLLGVEQQQIATTALGQRFLNDVTARFLNGQENLQ
ncbi:MAG: radical SAM family heme chaperone HemW [Pseudomonadota bacterium]